MPPSRRKRPCAWRGGDRNRSSATAFAKASQGFGEQQLTVLRILVVLGNHKSTDLQCLRFLWNRSRMQFADDDVAVAQDKCLWQVLLQL